MVHFVRTFSMVCVLKAYGVLLSKRFEIMEIMYSSKICLKMAGGGMHPPHPPPGSVSARTDNNVSYHYTNQPTGLASA